MRNLTLARRYAKALTDIGVRDGNCSQYVEQLQGVRKIINSHPELHRITTGPLLSRERLKEIISMLAEEIGLAKTVRNFLNLLVDKARIRYLNDITDIAQEILDEISGVARAQVTSAVPLSKEEVDSIRQNLEKYTGKKVIISLKEDSLIIGGIIAQVGDVVLDQSIRKQLNRLKEVLVQQ